MAGLSAEGFQRKLLSEVKEEIETTLKTVFGPQINLIAPSVFAKLVGTFSEREDLIWQLAEELYNAPYPDTATGVSLDNAVAFTGISRLGATFSKVLGQLLFGDVGTVVPAGTILSVAGNPTARFVTDDAVTLIAGTDEQQLITFSAAPTAGQYKLQYKDEITAFIAHNASNATIQSALNALAGLSGVVVTGSMPALTFAFGGADGKQDQPTLSVVSSTLVNGITPVTAVVTTPVPGVPQGSVDMTAESSGPVQAPAGTLTVIETPVAGLNTTKNPLDAQVGRNVETDNELRARREVTLQVSGSATVDAIRSRLLAIEGVTDAVIFENTSLVTDGDGVPAKSYECVVDGGDEQTIIQTIWDTKPAGIYTHGNVLGQAVDSMGLEQDIRFSRPTDVDIWIELDITPESGFPTDGAQQIEDALLAFGAALGVGDDVIVYPKLICSLDSVPGINDIEVRIGIAVSPTLDNNIVITNRQRARFDSTRITVNVL